MARGVAYAQTLAVIAAVTLACTSATLVAILLARSGWGGGEAKHKVEDGTCGLPRRRKGAEATLVFGTHVCHRLEGIKLGVLHRAHMVVARKVVRLEGLEGPLLEDLAVQQHVFHVLDAQLGQQLFGREWHVRRVAHTDD